MKKIVLGAVVFSLASIGLLKSNDLTSPQIFVYKMQPVVSEGDNISAPAIQAQAPQQNPSAVTLEIPHQDIAQRRQKEFYQAPQEQAQPYHYHQDVASQQPLNIIPNFVPMNTNVSRLSYVIHNNNQVMQASIRDNGPVLFRTVSAPQNDDMIASKNYITLPINAAKPTILTHH